MSKATRTANREARRIIRFTRRVWNPAQVAAWAGGYRSTEAEAFGKVSDKRFAMCLDRIKAHGSDGGRMRRALRATEVKG